MQPWDTPEIHIEAKKRVRHSSRETAEQYARQIEIAVETKGDVLEVRTVMPAQKEGWDWVEWLFGLDWLFERRVREASVSYEISTPHRMDANLVSTERAPAREDATPSASVSSLPSDSATTGD
jgi:hypothetical protein